MKSGATPEQFEAVMTRWDAQVGYRCRCEYCRGFVDKWAALIVPDTHRIIALDDLVYLRDNFDMGRNHYGYPTLEGQAELILDRIDALIAAPDGEQETN